MLLNLTIKNFILIDFVNLNFHKGFSVMTGETGAGKSIILDALSFVVGERSNQKYIRENQNESVVIAEFDISNNTTLHPLLREHSIFSEHLIIRRSINKEGKSKAYINDIPVTTSLLKQIGDFLLEIHGQHDQTWLLNENYHLEILDNFTQNKADLEELKSIYRQYKEQQKKLEDLENQKYKLEEEKDYLEFVLKELEELDPKENEEEELMDQRLIAQNQTKISEFCSNIFNELKNKSVLSTIHNAQKILSRNANLMEQLNLSSVNEHLSSAYNSITLVMDELECKMNSLHFDNNELEVIDLRLLDLRTAARKYRCQINELSSYTQSIRDKLGSIENIDNALTSCQNEINKLKRDYLRIAEKISEKRKIEAFNLEKRITEELKNLKMEKITFIVDIKSIPEELTDKGIDKVTFLVSTNIGTSLDKINKIASGGELSRFMLAAKIALTHNFNKTIIFDEIDTGVSGSTAYAIGKKLFELSRYNQVLVVTHQPQVASFSDNHYFIEKHSADAKTITSVKILNNNAKVLELARMLSGENITEEAKLAAEKLIEDSCV